MPHVLSSLLATLATLAALTGVEATASVASRVNSMHTTRGTRGSRRSRGTATLRDRARRRPCVPSPGVHPLRIPRAHYARVVRYASAVAPVRCDCRPDPRSVELRLVLGRIVDHGV